MLPQPLAQGPFAQVNAAETVTPGEGGIVVQRQARHVGARIAQLAQQCFDLCGRSVGFADVDDRRARFEQRAKGLGLAVVTARQRDRNGLVQGEL